MAFTEKTKLKVKKKAMFQCCWCKAVNIDVHHIKPQKHGGSDDISNAAPLCQSCHNLYGDNSSKRKQIKQMRDHWYETVEKMYSNRSNNLYPLIEKMDAVLEKMDNSQKRTRSDVSEIKNTLKEISNRAIDSMTAGTVDLVASNIVNASGASLFNVRSENILPMKYCKKCGTGYWPADTFHRCLSCGGELSS